ncbi:DENN domain-containing protein 3-like isoform X3 [Physeter macrocephalus]|uniref:DENN domain-containing protein 3-like isoform X3 n=1 Tax=Physeter macrocephalus TaxID=9755 RepID=A0A455B383_PHYMC|nr:DENN domain-containing protein 3-like isoform X3 [Physeter catodon]|eukprot:XP_028342543.1 DENN domain-containing protein 3-like isoform X3 [Physeter catodon]
MEQLDKNECVYKLSSSVKTNRGVGKIAMTQKRLFLLTEGRPGYVEISTFRDIEEVRSTTVAFLLLRIPTLKIKMVSKKEVFEANLKTECDLWHLMVKEMWAGKKLADDHKDPQYVQQALTHVLLMDAVVGALQSPGAIYAASKLSYFDKMKNEMPMAVPKTTSETLKHKINPSAGETFPRAIDVLLYTPGHLDPAEKVEDAHPKLWCALNGGRVVVFDASSWTVLQHCFKAGASKLNCMVMAEQSQVWVGSEDSVIYIINVHSMSCNKQLTDHRSSVTGLVVQDRAQAPSTVYSCSADGTVLAWNASSLRVTSRFQLPGDGLSAIRLHGGRLWCSTLAAAAPNHTLNQDGLLRTARIFIPQCPTKSREVPSEETQVTVQLTECLSFFSFKDHIPQLWLISSDCQMCVCVHPWMHFGPKVTC